MCRLPPLPTTMTVLRCAALLYATRLLVLREYLSKRPQLVGIGTDPGLLDRNGTLVTQRKPCEQVVLLEDGLFVFE